MDHGDASLADGVSCLEPESARRGQELRSSMEGGLNCRTGAGLATRTRIGLSYGDASSWAVCCSTFADHPRVVRSLLLTTSPLTRLCLLCPQHLVEWDPDNAESLLQVVKELIQQYHLYQCERLSESSRLLFEYQSLLDDPLYGKSMEVFAGKKNSWTGEFSARFLLKLPVDFSNIPTYLLKDTSVDPGEDVALLSVSFEDAEATQVFPKLYLSPRIENALGGPSALHIPAFPGGGCLIDYVPQVCQLLTNKVQYVIQGYHKRREYIAAFLSHFGMGVVEYDAEGFTKLTLLLVWKDFCFLVHIDLPLYFPRDQPMLTFQSVYHFTNSGQPYSQVQKSYPYSPRWDGNEMAKRAKKVTAISWSPPQSLDGGPAHRMVTTHTSLMSISDDLAVLCGRLGHSDLEFCQMTEWTSGALLADHLGSDPDRHRPP
ncbi:BABA2 protein, partial [Polypterus senegalus]